MMRKGLIGLALMSLAGLSLAETTIVSVGDSYKYIDATAATVFGGSTTGWTGAGYDDSGWFTGSAVFSNAGGIGSNPQMTLWDADYDPKLRKEVTLGSSFTSVVVRIAVDNGFDLYINGTHAGGANAEGYTHYWEYEFSVSPSLFTVGSNIIAVQLEDHGGATAFDMEIVGDPVPEPATMATLSVGAALLARRRRKS